jgi:hypothetical protein
MNLLEIRTQLVEVSGRHDLVVDTTAYLDDGADFYINAGQRLLDRLETIPQSKARVFRLTAAGDYGVIFPTCRSILEVWVADAVARQEMRKYSMDEFRHEYFNEPVGLITQDVPQVYTPAWLRVIPDRIAIADLEAIVGYADIPVGVTERMTYNGIIFMPPADGEYQIEVVGYFYSPALVDEDHTSFWSEIHPEMLLWAAQAIMEVDHRNTQGFRDWINAINTFATTIGFDFVEEDISGVDQMEG